MFAVKIAPDAFESLTDPVNPEFVPAIVEGSEEQATFEVP